jgi:outer membrane protein TolC
MFRASLVTAAAVLYAATAAAQPAPDRLSIDDAIALALQHNRSLANTAMQEEKAVGDVATARSHRLPQFKLNAQASELLRPVDVSFKAGTFGTYPGVGPIPSTDTAITTPQKPAFILDASVAQPLTQLHRLNLNIALSEKSRELDREAIRSTRVTVVNEVKRLYYSILQSESAIEASGVAITRLRELQRVVDDRLVQQVALQRDVLDVRTRLAQSEHARLQLLNGVAAQKEQLNLLIGRDVRTAFETTGVPAPTLFEADLTAARTRALEDRPDIRQARLKAEQAGLAKKIAKSQSIPDVSLLVSYLSPMNIEGAPRNIATAAVRMEWEPFDWGRRSRTEAAKDVEVRQAANALREAEERAVVEVNTQFRRLEEARSLLRVAGLAQEAAREGGRVRQAQYVVRAALLADVLQANSTQADADNQYHQALIALWQARADFERALGQDVTK